LFLAKLTALPMKLKDKRFAKGNSVLFFLQIMEIALQKLIFDR
jgi:hypothetical protein